MSAIAHSATVNESGWLYPAEREILDFGSPQLEIAISLRQLSATVGGGHEWRGRIAVG